MSSTTPTLHSDSRSAEPHERSRRTPATGMGVRTLLAHGIEQFPEAVRKLDPRHMWRTPVMFLVWLGSLLTTLVAIVDPSVFAASIAAWLWLTVIFGNLAEAIAEGRGKAQADTLRQTRVDSIARRLMPHGGEERVPGTELRVGDRVVVEAGEVIPGDGDVVDGVATVDESAITGESAPVIRESGGDRCAVTGGTTVLSDRIVVEITSKPGETFIDRMIALVEGAERQKTPNEIALGILLTTLTIIFVLAVMAIWPMASYSGHDMSLVVLVALLAGPISRRLMGRTAIVAAALVGAIITIAGDYVGAYLVPGDNKLPVGIITGLAGAPVLAWLLLTSQRPPRRSKGRAS